VRTFKPWRIVHVSLADALPDLPADPASDGAFVVFWHRHVPLGQLLVRAPLLPIPSQQLVSVASRIVAPAIAFRTVRDGFAPPLPVPARKQPSGETAKLSQLLALDRPLAALAGRTQAPGRATPSVSVVVCTRNRPEDLEKCLTALAGLAPAPAEIIVVDNDPRSGGTRRVTDCHPAVRYVPEERPGLSAARNTGVLAATGDIVAFTDDDVIVDPRWVGAICEAFEDRAVASVTGLVLPAELETAAQYAFQTDVLGWGWGYRAVDFDRTFFDATKDVGVPAWRLGAGANMAFRREVFDRVGLFDERLGAGASGCSEDSELWYRLLADGHRCRYWPAAVVLHRHRADWDGLRQQMYTYMRGHVTALFVQFERYRHWGNIYRAFVALPWYLATLGFHTGKRWLARQFYDPQDGTIAQPVVPQILGAIAGYGYYLRHRRRPSNAAVVERERTQVTVR
jgi:GT2 family glycosyltransferase